MQTDTLVEPSNAILQTTSLYEYALGKVQLGKHIQFVLYKAKKRKSKSLANQAGFKAACSTETSSTTSTFEICFCCMS